MIASEVPRDTLSRADCVHRLARAIETEPGRHRQPSIGEQHPEPSREWHASSRSRTKRVVSAKPQTAVNLAASLAAAEQKTLLVDGDPQGNATSGIGVQVEKDMPTVYDVLLGERSIADATVKSVHFRHLDVVPATPDLAGAEIELVDRQNRERQMRTATASVRDKYDYVLIDCPPSLGLITLNMLAAGDALLIPLQCEYYALEGLSQLLNTVHLIQRSVNPDLAIDGVLLTMYDARLNLSRQVATEAREYFGARCSML